MARRQGKRLMRCNLLTIFGYCFVLLMLVRLTPSQILQFTCDHLKVLELDEIDVRVLQSCIMHDRLSCVGSWKQVIPIGVATSLTHARSRPKMSSSTRQSTR